MLIKHLYSLAVSFYWRISAEHAHLCDQNMLSEFYI